MLLDVLIFAALIGLFAWFGYDVLRDCRKRRHPRWSDNIPTIGGYEVIETLRRAERRG
jgi:hypothetical protein